MARKKKIISKIRILFKIKYLPGEIFKKAGLVKNSFNYLIKISTPYNEIAIDNIAIFTQKRLFFSLSLLVTFLIIYGMLFFCFPPHLIFRNTTTNGGDMGAHNYIAKFFIDELFPDFRMSGWDMGWFAGMPMLTFYFPLPYLLIALLSKIFVYNIAFKLVTILGSLILPVSVYYFGKLFRFKYPYPEFASIGAMAFLYMESHKIYGGNFLGTFAGEFSYSISFGLVFIFIAALYRGIEREKFDWLFSVNCILLACIVLTHLITVIAVLIIVPSLFIIKRTLKCARYIAAVFAVGFLLSAFWSVPFLFFIKWTPTMKWTNIKNPRELFPLELAPGLMLGAAGVFFSMLRKDRKTIPILWSITLFISFFFAWNGERLYNARLLPFIFIFIYLLASYGLTQLYWIFVTIIPHSYLYYINSSINYNGFRSWKISFYRFKKQFVRFVIFAFVPILAFLASGAILAGNPLGPAWARHNYTGFESKQDWILYNDLMQYLDSLPYGRVMFEFDKKIIQKFGTPRAFELIPYWTKQSGMEGLLVESSLTAPFHYINQAELSVKPRGTVAGWKVPPRNYQAAMKHLIYMNISYIMVSSPEVIKDLENDSRVKFLNKIGPYYFYEIIRPHNCVEVMRNIPYRYKPEDWVWDMREWYLNPDNMDNPVIYDNGSSEVKIFPEIKKEELENVPENPVKGRGKVIYENVEREKIEFVTTAIGQPHLIKVSYFPNWQAVGAEGPYLVSPSFMMVIPTQSKVTVYYGMTFANRIGVAFSILGWAIISLVLVLNLVFYLKLRASLKKADHK